MAKCNQLKSLPFKGSKQSPGKHVFSYISILFNTAWQNSKSRYMQPAGSGSDRSRPILLRAKAVLSNGPEPRAPKPHGVLKQPMHYFVISISS